MLPECALLLLLALGLLLVAQVGVARAVAPGVELAGLEIGGLTVAEAEAQLSDQVGALVARPLTLRSGDRVWTRTYADLGLSIDVPASVALAPRHNVPGEWERLMRDQSDAAPLAHETRLPLVVALDAERFAGALGPIEAALLSAPIDAEIAFDGQSVTVLAGRDGRGLDRDALRAELTTRLEGLNAGALALPLRRVPAQVSTRAALELKEKLAQALFGPMTVRVADQSWALDPANLDLALTILPASGDSNGDLVLQVRLDPGSVAPRLETIVGAVATAPVAARVDDSGTVPRLIPAVPGRAVDRQVLVAAIEVAIAAGEREIVVPVEAVAPSSEASTEGLLAELGIVARLAVGESDFAGSDANRVTNVRIATELVDGILVPPGGVFSFNQALGVIVDEPRFVPAGATEGGIAGTSVGGGVCQVSTSIFRAALLAGLPIVEWWPHTYRSVYYENGGWGPGFDASIAQPEDDSMIGSDFQFANPTSDWLLIRAAIGAGTVLTAEIHGAETGYDVDVSEPVFSDGEQAGESVEEIDPSLPAGSVIPVQPARDGVTVTVARIARDASGAEISSDSFVSVYKAQGPLYRVSPDQAGQSLASS
jgi:vancomycin resistance protein YoaR